MSLEDFDEFIELDEKGGEFKGIEYYLFNLDELLFKLNESRMNAIESELAYKKKYNKLHVETNWDEVNALREGKGLTKITTQKVKDADIELRMASSYESKEYFKSEHKYYKTLFEFISKNYESLQEAYKKQTDSEKKILVDDKVKPLIIPKSVAKNS